MSSSNRRASRNASIQMAFCGLITALSVALMLAGGTIPIATYCIPMACSILLLPVLVEFGKKTAWTTFAAVSVIAVILGIDKEAAFFYLFIGYYPLIKWDIDRIRNRGVRSILKYIIFSFSIILMYCFLGFIMGMSAVLAEFAEMGSVFTLSLLILYNFCMQLYDRLLLPLLFLYAQRIKPHLRFFVR